MSAIFARFGVSIFVMVVIAVTGPFFTGGLQAQKQIQDKTFVVIGSGTVNSGDIQAARAIAIKESLVTAVALMTADILQTDTLVDHFQQINEIIYGHTDKYIQNYKVLTEDTSGRYHRVVVQATVAGDKVAKLLAKEGILQTESSLPSVMFLIAEQNVKEILPRYWWGIGMDDFQSISENALADIFQQKGFVVVSHQGVRLHTLVDWVADARPELTDGQAAELAARLKADVAVIGTSNASESTNLMGSEMKSFNGSLTARALSAKSGEEILTITRNAVATNVDEYEGGQEALSSVATVAGEALADQLIAAWRKLQEQPSRVEIVVEGTHKLANFVKFRKALSSISGVEGIRVKEIKANETILLVDYHGKTEDLASALMRNTFENFGIDIYEVTSNLLKIALVSG